MLDKRTERCIIKDAFNILKICVALYFLDNTAIVILPVINAYLIGSMTDSLLYLDFVSIKSSLVTFSFSLVCTIILVPLLSLIRFNSLFKTMAVYDNFILRKFFNCNLRYIMKQDYGEVIERLNGTLGDFCWVTVKIFSIPFIILFYIGFIVYLIVRQNINALFMALVLILPLMSICKAKLTADKNARYKTLEDEYTEKNRTLENTITDNKDFLKKYGVADFISFQMNINFKEYMKQYGFKKNKFESINSAFDFLIDNLSQYLLIIAGILLIVADKITLGTLLSGFLMLSSVKGCYAYISDFLEVKSLKKECVERIAFFYNHEEDKKFYDGRDYSVISLKGIGFGYENDENLLDNLNISLEKGSVTHITGKNGSGKSTLLNIICGLFTPLCGNIYDKNSNKVSLVNLRERISFASQNDSLFTGTVFENLFAGDCNKDDARDILSNLGFGHALDYLIEGDGANLSPGEKKKVILTRCLLKKADFYVFDEPFNHLDNNAQRYIEGQISNLIEEKSAGVVIVSHKDIGIKESLNRIEIGKNT